MIIGTGVDLIEVARIEALLEQRGSRALERIFAPAEISYCETFARPGPSLAARFAAKEAFFKAIGTGFGRGGRWIDVQVLRSPSGRPRLRLRGRAARLARRRGIRRAHLTLSHTDGFAIAQVVLEGDGPQHRNHMERNEFD